MRRKGIAVIQFALMVTALMGFGAISVDRNLLQVKDHEAQNAADAIAHAAARRLDGTQAGIDAARSTASRLAGLNRVGGVPLSVNDPASGASALVELGRWSDGVFTAGTAEPGKVTSVRVSVDRTGISSIFALGAFNRRELAVAARSVAQGGGTGAARCPAPIAIPDCSLPPSALVCNTDLILNSDGNDNAGWAALGSSRPNASSLRGAIEGCGMGTVETADIVSLNNGSINGVMGVMADAVSLSTDTWNPAWGTQPARGPNSGVTPYGRVLNTHFLVFDDPNNCTATKYTATNVPLVGFVNAAVYDVDTKGTVNQRRIRARLVCAVESKPPGGGGFFGSVAAPKFVAESGG